MQFLALNLTDFILEYNIFFFQPQQIKLVKQMSAANSPALNPNPNPKTDSEFATISIAIETVTHTHVHMYVQMSHGGLAVNWLPIDAISAIPDICRLQSHRYAYLKLLSTRILYIYPSIYLSIVESCQMCATWARLSGATRGCRSHQGQFFHTFSFLANLLNYFYF